VHALKVHAPGGSYPIVVGRSLLDRPEAYGALLKGRQVLIVTNTVVAPLYLERVQSALGDHEQDAFVLPDGEREKTLATFSLIIDRLVAAGFNRDATIVALGGGVIGDLSGFAAACYHRGIACLQLPTTLLAQVDSSVGGKTAVNHAAGKNLVGAFHQPVGVLADVTTLETLPDREYRAGLAEVLKYGIGLDGEFFAWLEDRIGALASRDPAAVETAVAWSCAIKARIVAEDERERGTRALLNLGHTFGHAVEAYDGYRGDWLHGEAVAVGMRLAAALAREEDRLDPADEQRINRLLDSAGLPDAPPPIPVDQWLALMGRDKKVAGGRIRLVLPIAIGRSEITGRFSDEALERILQRTYAGS
jgi:3-dehydroquinate synthase